MEYPIHINPDFSITAIEVLYTDKPGNKPVIIRFDFFEDYGHINMDISHADSAWLSFGNLECNDALSDSFETALDDHWDKIKEYYYQFIQEDDSKQ